MSRPEVPFGSKPAVAGPASRLSGTLGVSAIVFMVVAAAAPLAVVGSGVPLGILIGNGAGFPSMYLAATVVLLLFAVGLATMARHVPRPGAFFTFVGYGLGRPLGLASAYLALLSYTTVQVAGHAYFGYVIGLTVSGLGGPELPWWSFSLVSIAAVAALGYRNIDLSGKVLAVLLVAEVGIVIALVLAIVFSKGPDGRLSLAPFEWSSITSGAVGVGLTFAISAFLGFESTAIYRDEARNPRRTIPRATYIAVVGVGVFYTFASWGMVMAWGPEGVVDAAAADPGSMLLRTTFNYLGTAGVITINVLLITSIFACVLSFHNVIARYQFAMAHAGVLPQQLGVAHPRKSSPHISSMVQTLCATALIISSVGLDPVLTLLTWGGGVATLAVVLLMTLTSVAILVYFAKTKADRNPWRTIIAPALGLIGLTGASVLIISYFPMQLSDVDADGNPVFGTLTWVWLGVIGTFAGIGLVQALILRKRDPEKYAGMLDAISSAPETASVTEPGKQVPVASNESHR